MKVILVGGARPNFVKIAPILQAMQELNETKGRTFFEPFFVHTGQHYDYEMSKIFFEDLRLPEPDVYLGIGSGTHAAQTGRIMIELEEVLFKEKPELVIVVGDVNSTLAAALSAVKLHIPIAHVEAGLRSFDKTMPEEVNRVLTDQISDYLFTPSPDAGDNLKREGIRQNRIYFVGNVMVDSLLDNLGKAEKRFILSKLGLEEKGYTVLTLHRPSNVDERKKLFGILKSLCKVSSRIPIIFPVHPRTRKNIQNFKLESFFHENDNIRLAEPLGYLDFICLMMNSRFVMTDSGGVQEETTALNIPCLTLRNTTEWGVTVAQGRNTVVGDSEQRLVDEAFRILDGQSKESTSLELWDGKTAERIVEIISRRELE